MGAILLPKVARRASSAADGSAFSRSLLLIKKHAAVPVDRPSATACSRPASTPVEASITKSTPSVAANPSMTSYSLIFQSEGATLAQYRRPELQ